MNRIPGDMANDTLEYILLWLVIVVVTPLVCHERVVTTFFLGREAAGIAIDSAQISKIRRFPNRCVIGMSVGKSRVTVHDDQAGGGVGCSSRPPPSNYRQSLIACFFY